VAPPPDAFFCFYLTAFFAGLRQGGGTAPRLGSKRHGRGSRRGGGPRLRVYVGKNRAVPLSSFWGSPSHPSSRTGAPLEFARGKLHAERETFLEEIKRPFSMSRREWVSPAAAFGALVRGTTGSRVQFQASNENEKPTSERGLSSPSQAAGRRAQGAGGGGEARAPGRPWARSRRGITSRAEQAKLTRRVLSTKGSPQGETRQDDVGLRPETDWVFGARA